MKPKVLSILCVYELEVFILEVVWVNLWDCSILALFDFQTFYWYDYLDEVV